MASHHDDELVPEETSGYKLSQPKQSLAAYKQMGKLEHKVSLVILFLRSIFAMNADRHACRGEI